jgi:nucleotide-binding universal stress UspA family protein
MFKHILIPTDGSETAFKAVHAAIDFAKESGAKVTGFSAMDGSTYHHVGAYVTDAVRKEIARRVREAAEAHVEKIAAVARAAGVPFEGYVSEATEAYEGIVAAANAKGCDLICMASKGVSGFQGFVTGSVTQQVLTHSKIPVLVFR